MTGVLDHQGNQIVPVAVETKVFGEIKSFARGHSAGGHIEISICFLSMWGFLGVHVHLTKLPGHN